MSVPYLTDLRNGGYGYATIFVLAFVFIFVPFIIIAFGFVFIIIRLILFANFVVTKGEDDFFRRIPSCKFNNTINDESCFEASEETIWCVGYERFVMGVPIALMIR